MQPFARREEARLGDFDAAVARWEVDLFWFTSFREFFQNAFLRFGRDGERKEVEIHLRGEALGDVGWCYPAGEGD